MTMSAPMPGEPLAETAAEPAVEPGPHPGDLGAPGRVWLLTIAVLVIALAATVCILAWQWLGPASGTVAR